MKNLLLAALAVLTVSGTAYAQSAGPYREGVHYFEIEQPPGFRPVDGVVVTEAFSYLCNHCMTFEPYVEKWQERLPEGVVFKRIPVEFGRATWALYARAYVAASVLGIADESHAAMMDALWKEGRQMRSMRELAEFYAQFGVEPERFMATAQSFAVDAQLRREQQLVRSYGVSGTPTMIVNGRYRVAAGGAIASFDEMLAVVDALVEQELEIDSTAQASVENAVSEGVASSD